MFSFYWLLLFVAHDAFKDRGNKIIVTDKECSFGDLKFFLNWVQRLTDAITCTLTPSSSRTPERPLAPPPSWHE